MSKRWSKEEDERLFAALEKHGPRKWGLIAAAVQTRDSNSCFQHWTRVLHPRISRAPFTEKERDILVEQIRLHGEHKWSSVKSRLPGRTDLQCRSQWKRMCSSNDPRISSIREKKHRAKGVSPEESVFDSSSSSKDRAESSMEVEDQKDAQLSIHSIIRQQPSAIAMTAPATSSSTIFFGHGVPNVPEELCAMDRLQRQSFITPFKFRYPIFDDGYGYGYGDGCGYGGDQRRRYSIEFLSGLGSFYETNGIIMPLGLQLDVDEICQIMESDDGSEAADRCESAPMDPSSYIQF